jgi:hypothetical protein
MHTRIVNESYYMKTNKADLSVERRVNRRLQDKYEKEHQKNSKLLIQIKTIKDKNKGIYHQNIILELRDNLNQIDDKFLS